jgi:iron complex outermembrane receptor protein
MQRSTRRHLWLAGVSGLAALTAGASAQAADAAAASDSTDVDAVIVTGTRTTGLKAVDSPAPIQVLGADILKRTGQPDLIQSLAQNMPSLQAQSFGSDASAFHLSIKLRGLSPNHTLVLINGKRRHGTANVVVSGGAFGGNASADIGLIPQDEIDHVEVLTDGAAAQYGTDAIAGVVNIILKKSTSGGSIEADGGQYFDGGGRTGHVSMNMGFAPVENSYVNVTLDTKYHGFSFRGDVDPRLQSTLTLSNGTVIANPTAAGILANYPSSTKEPNYPYVNRVAGDAQYRQTTFIYNAGYEFSDHLQFYAFGSGAYKWGQAYENFRPANIVTGVSPTDVPFPVGFSPKESVEENDYAFTEGLRGDVAGWNWDFATSYGYDIDKVYVLNSSNITLYKQNSTATQKGFAPSTYHDGDFVASQFTNTLDVTHDFEVGLATPLTFAAGLEYRKERYAIHAGDPASYYGTGAASFFGYGPVNAGGHIRHTDAGYVDLSVRPTKAWIVDAAVRHEHYSDFGNTTVAKLTSRYDISDAIAVRGTVSTGFRAPTLAEEFYSGINVGPTSISGIFAPNSPGAKFLGASGLGPEKSKNYSVGFVAHVLPGLTMTLDLYQIDINNRIVQSGNFFGFNANKNIVQSPSVLTALANSGITIDPAIFAAASGTVAISTFVNGADTRNQGADFVATYPSDFGDFGHVDWSLSANYNTMKIKKLKPPPSNVNQTVILLDSPAQSQLTRTTPRYRATAGAFWTLDRFSVNLRESFYSSSVGVTNDPITPIPDTTRIKPALVTDLDLSVKVLKAVKLTVGANNLFNKYPSKNNTTLRDNQLRTNAQAYAGQYPAFSPFGINGGYYYGKVTVSF